MRYMRHMTHLLARRVIEFEKNLLLGAIREFNGQATKIADHFKMGRNTLYNRLEYHGINLSEMRKNIRSHVRVVNGKLIIPVGHKKRTYIRNGR